MEIYLGKKLWFGDSILVVDENVIRDFEIYLQSGVREIDSADISEKEFKSILFERAVFPAMKYLAENHHPHTKLIIESNIAEVVEGLICTGINNNFLVD